MQGPRGWRCPRCWGTSLPWSLSISLCPQTPPLPHHPPKTEQNLHRYRSNFWLQDVVQAFGLSPVSPSSNHWASKDHSCSCPWPCLSRPRSWRAGVTDSLSQMGTLSLQVRVPLQGRESLWTPSNEKEFHGPTGSIPQRPRPREVTLPKSHRELGASSLIFATHALCCPWA